MEYSSGGYYMIKLIKITKKYIIWAYTTDRHILIIGISLLGDAWRWHCYRHPAKLCLSAYQVMFDYSTLKAHISKTTNDRNKYISDSESGHLEGIVLVVQITYMHKGSKEHWFIYLRTTLRERHCDITTTDQNLNTHSHYQTSLIWESCFCICLSVREKKNRDYQGNEIGPFILDNNIELYLLKYNTTT